MSIQRHPAADIRRPFPGVRNSTALAASDARRARRRRLFGRVGSAALSLALAVAAILPTGAHAQEQCTTTLSGLRLPVGSTLSDHGNLLIAESGDGTPNSGRISIVDRNGTRRTLLDGMPSAPADVGDPSGPSGLFMQGRSLFVTVGEGDIAIMGPRPGTAVLNPAGSSSPIFSSILELFFTGNTEARTNGFTLTQANQQALARGRLVWLRDGHGNSLFIRMVTNLPDFVPSPLPGVPGNIHATNPFAISGFGLWFYVNDGGRNSTWRVNRLSGTAAEFASYPDVPNPLFGHVGGPSIQAVPTGINTVGHQLLVSLFRGAPFATGVSSVETLDPFTGVHTPLVTGLTTGIDTSVVRRNGHDDLLVLEMAASGPFFSGPGTVLRFRDFGGAPEIVADCLAAPTSMSLDRWTNTLYVTEQEGGLVRIPLH